MMLMDQQEDRFRGVEGEKGTVRRRRRRRRRGRSRRRGICFPQDGQGDGAGRS